MKRHEWEKQLAKNTVSHNTTSRQIKLSYSKLDINWISRYETMSLRYLQPRQIWDREGGQIKVFFAKLTTDVSGVKCEECNIATALLTILKFSNNLFKACIAAHWCHKARIGLKKVENTISICRRTPQNFDFRSLRQPNHDFNWIFVKHSRRFRIVLSKITLSTYVLLTK